MIEEWKIIPNSSNYAISNFGRVKRLEHKKWCKANNSFSLYKERILKLSNDNTKGYWRIRIWYGDKNVMESVHRLVAQAFIPNPDNLPQVNHIDTNKDNNYYLNLEWCTNLYNMQHAIENGLHLDRLKKIQGEKSHLNKYSEETIKRIPLLLERGLKLKEIAEELKIPISLISEVKGGRAWKHLNLFSPKIKNN